MKLCHGLNRFGALWLLSLLVTAILAIACDSNESEPTLEPIPDTIPTPTVKALPRTPAPQPDSATATAVAEREAYCEANALPTATPEPDETPTPAPTPPISVAAEDIPDEWRRKMDEIEAWVRDYYLVGEDQVGEFTRRFVEDAVWREWQADRIARWAAMEESTEDLWEQTYRGLTFLSAGADFAEFYGGYLGDQVVGSYNVETREILLRVDEREFDLLTEATYVHEYAHHVQNERYDFTSFSDCFRADQDASSALSALIEGDAMRTELAYVEEVIGLDRFLDVIDEIEYEGEEASNEPMMYRYQDEEVRFTYQEGPLFIFTVALISDCEHCDTERSRIDDAFRSPPFTTEQILHTTKYFNGEERARLRLTEDALGEDWEVKFASTLGKATWIAYLVALTDTDAREIETEHPGWMGDYEMMFEDGEGRALYLAVAQWENKRYIESLAEAFDSRDRLVRVEPSQTASEDFDRLYLWDGESGSIAMGLETEPVERIRTMYLVVGSDTDTVQKAAAAARAKLIIE